MSQPATTPEAVPSYQAAAQEKGQTDMATPEKAPFATATGQQPTAPEAHHAQVSGTSPFVPVATQPGVQMVQMQAGQAPVLTICAQQGKHIPTKKFGPIGLIMGICFCPCGLIWTFKDTRTVCTRCGEMIEQGSCFSG